MYCKRGEGRGKWNQIGSGAVVADAGKFDLLYSRPRHCVPEFQEYSKGPSIYDVCIEGGGALENLLILRIHFETAVVLRLE